MPPADDPSDARFLVVTEQRDEPVQACLDALGRARAAVDVVPDVYSAAARLALNGSIRHVIVDVRGLDDREMMFFRICGRRYPGVELIAPVFNGAADRMNLTGGDVRHLSVEAFIARFQPPTGASATIAARDSAQSPAGEVESELASPAQYDHGDEPAEWNPPPPNETPSARIGPLSTDGGPDRDSGPALHEAVRMRMSGGQSGPVRRAPSGQPVVARPEHGPPQTSDSPRGNLTRDEVEALLADAPVDDVDSNLDGTDGVGP